MKCKNVKRIIKNPIFVNFKKHYCPYCNEILKKVKVSRIVNSRSSESKYFDFRMYDTFMIGDVKFIWTEFQCPICNTDFSIDEMKEIEKNRKKFNNEK